MDLAQLYRHHQIAQLNHRRARSESDRKAYSELVTYYAGRIRELERERGTPLLPPGH